MNITETQHPIFPIDIPAMVDEAKAQKIKVYPCHVNRASSIGHPCDRYLVYMRTHWEEKKLHGVELQRIFDLGNLFEKAVLDDLREAGLYLEEQQAAAFDRRYQLSAHIDGKIPLQGHKYPVEIKSISPYLFDKINDWQDFLEAKYLHLRGYPYQMITYLYLHNEDLGIMLLKNKVSGAIKQIVIPLDYTLAEEILQKCERINAHVEANTLPEQIEWTDTVCGECGFLHICYPGRDFGAGFQVVDDAELLAMLEKREGLARAVKAYKEVDEALKAIVKGKTGLLVGDWIISGKLCKRKGYTVADQEYWLTSFKKVQ